MKFEVLDCNAVCNSFDNVCSVTTLVKEFLWRNSGPRLSLGNFWLQLCPAAHFRVGQITEAARDSWNKSRLWCTGKLAVTTPRGGGGSPKVAAPRTAALWRPESALAVAGAVDGSQPPWGSQSRTSTGTGTATTR